MHTATSTEITLYTERVNKMYSSTATANLQSVVGFRVIVLEARRHAQSNIAVWTLNPAFFADFLAVGLRLGAADDALPRRLHLLCCWWEMIDKVTSGQALWIPDRCRSTPRRSRCLRSQMLGENSLSRHPYEIGVINGWRVITVVHKQNVRIPE